MYVVMVPVDRANPSSIEHFKNAKSPGFESHLPATEGTYIWTMGTLAYHNWIMYLFNVIKA